MRWKLGGVERRGWRWVEKTGTSRDKSSAASLPTQAETQRKPKSENIDDKHDMLTYTYDPRTGKLGQEDC